MHHILGKKSPMGSIEVPIDREYPHKELVNACQIAIHFYGRGLPSKWENAKKRHSRVRIGMKACVTRPQNFFARPYNGSIHPHKISDRYESPNPFKNAVTSERVHRHHHHHHRTGWLGAAIRSFQSDLFLAYLTISSTRREGPRHGSDSWIFVSGTCVAVFQVWAWCWFCIRKECTSLLALLLVVADSAR